MGALLEKLDTFGERLPTFNIKGNEKVNTRIGGIATLIIFAVVVAFGGLKLDHLLARKNPNLSSYTKDLDVDETLNLSERKFRMAFSIEPYYAPYEIKNDPDFVRWVFQLWGKKDGISYEKILPYHLCTEEDYAEFYPI